MRSRSLSRKSGTGILLRKIFAKLPDSLAPELLQLLTPEFFLLELRLLNSSPALTRRQFVLIHRNDVVRVGNQGPKPPVRSNARSL